MRKVAWGFVALLSDLFMGGGWSDFGGEWGEPSSGEERVEEVVERSWGG